MKIPKVNYYFLIACIFIIFIKCIQLPSQTIHAEIWAEAGTNYLQVAVDKNFWENLQTVDAGYLPILQRLIAVLIVQGFQLIGNYAMSIQMISLFCIALFSSIITLHIFRKLFPSDMLRCIIAVAIAFIPDYELNSFINFAYYGFIPVLLFLFVKQEKMKTNIFCLLSFFLLLVIMTKPHFLSFAPLFVIFGWVAWKKKNFRSVVFYCLAVCGLLLQIISLKLHPSHWGKTASHAKIVGEIIYSNLSIYKHVFLNDYIFGNIPAFLIYIILLSFIFFIFIKKQLQEKNKLPLYFFIACNAIAFFSISMTIATVQAIFPPEMPFFGVPNDRHFVFANIAVFLAGIMVLQSFIKNKKTLVVVVFLVMVNSGAFGYFYDKLQGKKILITAFDQYYTKQTSYSQWGTYSFLVKQPSYCIPINPFPWLLKKNCAYLTSPKEVQTTTKKVQEIHVEKNSWHIQSIILVNFPHNNQFHQLSLIGYDTNGNKIAEAKQITPDSSYRYIYFLFPKKQQGIQTIRFFQSGKLFPVIPTVIVLGTK